MDTHYDLLYTCFFITILFLQWTFTLHFLFFLSFFSPFLPFFLFCFIAVQLLCRIWFFVIPWTANTRLPCPSPSPRVCSDSCPFSQWWHPTTLSFVISFSYCLQSFPASGSFPMSQLFASGGQSIGSFSFNMCIQHSASFQRIFRVDTCYCYMLHYE